MCTHATARAIKCSPDRLALFVPAEDERTPKRVVELLAAVGPGERGRRTNCSAHARLNDHCTIPRCERVGRTTVTNAEYCVSTRENSCGGLLRPADRYLRPRSRFPVHAGEIRDFQTGRFE